jgi:hypothetical protein
MLMPTGYPANGFGVATDTFTAMVFMPACVPTAFMYKAVGCIAHVDTFGEKGIGEGRLVSSGRFTV